MGRGSLRNKGRTDGLHVISCWGKGAVSIPIYAYANRLYPLGPDLGLRLVRHGFFHEGDRQEYLDTQGFSVFLYDSTYHPVFVDQKNTAMEMILHGQRIATNGDVRLMP